MGRPITFEDAARLLENFDRDFDRSKRGIGTTLAIRAQRLSVTKYMQPKKSGGRDKRGRTTKHTALPANPPPGPIGIRSGDLRRTVKAIRGRVEGGRTIFGLRAGSNKVRYPAIHEFGGRTRPHIIKPKAGKVLRWFDGQVPVFRPGVRHPGSRIPARPFMRPALAEVLDEAPRVADEVFSDTLRRLFG